MKWVLVYKGKGMYEQDTEIMMRAMNEFVDPTEHQVDIVSAEDIIKGRLAKDVALLAIGGGYDLGLIEALGACGMKNIWDFVMSGGSYLGICSGAYFACDRIEFDKSGPQEVVGERFLKFYPGVGIGPLFKPYDYKNRSGAEAVTVDYHYLVDTGEPSQKSRLNKESQALQVESLKQSLDTGELSQRSGINKESQSPKSFKGCQSSDTADNDTKKRHDFQTCCGKSLWRECDINNIFSCKVYFNGGCCFNCPESEDSVTVLSHYLDLPDSPAAIVRCKVGAGMAILSGVHLEYEASDIDDGDTLVTDIIPCLKNSVKERKLIIKTLLKQLSITPK